MRDNRTPAQEWTHLHREVLVTLRVLLAGAIASPILIIAVLYLTH